MYILIGKLEIFLPGSHSLKEKRMTVKSISDKLKSRLKLSVAEIDEQDKWQRSVIGIAIVGKDSTYLSNLEEQILKMIEENYNLEILKADFEIIKK